MNTYGYLLIYDGALLYIYVNIRKGILERTSFTYHYNQNHTVNIQYFM